MDGFEERIRGWLTATAARFDLPDGAFAEAFQVVPIG